MIYILLLVIGIGGGWFAQKLFSGRSARRHNYGYEADIYQWLFENGIKTDGQAVQDLFNLLRLYLKDNKK